MEINLHLIILRANPMNPSRVKGLVRIFLLFSFCTPLFVLLAQSYVLLGPADGREWAHKKLVAVLAAVAEQVAAVLRDKSKLMRANMWKNQAELNGQPNVVPDHNGYADDKFLV